MTDQIEAYLREQFAADAQDAPLPGDLAGSARARVRHQRRHTAVVLVAALAALGATAGAIYGLAGSSRRAPPPAVDSSLHPAPTASSSPIASTSSWAVRLPRVLNAYLERTNAWTEGVRAPRDGGRVYCATTLVATGNTGDDLYVWALCAQVYGDRRTAVVGSVSEGPLVMHVVGGTENGHSVVRRVKGIDLPRKRSFDEDMTRLFPSGVADLMRDVELDRHGPDVTPKPTLSDLLTRARADLSAGRPALTGGHIRIHCRELPRLREGPVRQPAGRHPGPALPRQPVQEDDQSA